MDSLKLIPSVFFDAIARVVPGSAAMIAYLYFAHTTWSQILTKYLGAAFAGKDALLVSTILFPMTAYVVGQLLSPFAKGVQRIGEWKFFRWKKEPKKFKWKMEPKEKAPKGAYDWLRVKDKDAGAQCAKIRAEFTMHNGLFVTFVASLVWSLFFVCHRDWLLIAALTLFAVSTAIRGRTTSDTFDETVGKLSKAAGYCPPPSKAPQGAAA
jgi:hypothetical protein